MGLRIVTWNVNGIRNPFSYEPWRSKRTFASMFDLLEADIVIFQETKIQRKDLRDDMVLVPGWDCYFSLPLREKGKFGVVIYTRQSMCAPIRAEEGLTGTLRPPNSSIPFCELPDDEQIGGYPTAAQMIQAPDAPDIAANFDLLDSEGRCVMLEFPAFVLLGVYAPATRDETRAAFKTGYMNLLDVRIRNLIKMGKRVVLTGDLNVSKGPLDVANIEVDLRKSGSTVEEYFGTATRRMFNHFVVGGRITGPADEGREEQVLWDVCRGFHPVRTGMYTHWETKINARPANYGSRIDYILCSLDMKDWFSESDIQEGLHGSDHCPVYAVMNDKINVDGEERYTLDVMNPPGMFEKGKRLRPHAQKDMLPLSGRLIPEFTGRQSIRDMFAKKPSFSQAPSSQPRASQSPVKDEDTPGTAETPIETVEEYPSFTSVDESDGIISATSSFSGPGFSKSTSSNATKRAAPEKRSPSRPLKKTKSGSGGTTLPSPAKGQSQISGFFKPKTPKAPDPESNSAGLDADDGLSLSAHAGAGAAPAPVSTSHRDPDARKTVEGKPAHTPTERLGGDVDGSSDSTANGQAASYAEMDPLRDQEESKEGWAKLFSKPQIPQCEHGEPCKLMLSKKQGPNYMRSFYMCARPLGPSGEKEKGTSWRCRTFVWAKESKADK